MTKMIVVAAVAAAGWFGAVDGGHASTTVVAPPASPYPYQRWVDEGKVPTPDLAVSIREMSQRDPAWPCPNTTGFTPAACVIPETAEIYLDTARLHSVVRGTVWHELGHLFDFESLSPSDRDRFARLIGWPEDPWASSTTGMPAGEYFAEAYSLCARLGRKIASPQMMVGDERWIGKHRHFQICTLIERAARRTRP